ncbi:MAG: hypothetical protein JXQ87_13840 [Bacteroidia bacterium]
MKRFFLVPILFFTAFSFYQCDQPDDPIEDKFDWRNSLIGSEKPLSEANEPECVGPPLIDFEAPYDPELLRAAHFDSLGFIASVRMSTTRPEFVKYRCYYPTYKSDGSFHGFEVISYLKNLKTNNRIKLRNEKGAHYGDFGGQYLYFERNVNEVRHLYLLDCESLDEIEIASNSEAQSISPNGILLSYYNYGQRQTIVYNTITKKNEIAEEHIYGWFDDSTFLGSKNGVYYRKKYFGEDSTFLSSKSFGSSPLYISPNNKYIANNNNLFILDIDKDIHFSLPDEKIREETWCWNKGLWNFSFLPDNTIISGKYLYYPNYNTMEAKLTYQMRLISGPDYQTETYIELNLETERL